MVLTLGDQKELQARRLFRKLEVIERFREMMRAVSGVCIDQAERELQRLQGYLLEWAGKQRGKRLGLDAALSCKDLGSGSMDYADLVKSSDGWAASIVDTCVDDLAGLPGGMDMRSALRVRYLNEGVSREVGRPVRVFRHGRLSAMSLIEVDELAEKAEKALIPMVKRKGLPL